MTCNTSNHHRQPAPRDTLWNLTQSVLLFVGVGLVIILLLRPAIGLDLMWNILIPLAPALIVVAPGLWRNLCPMATLALLPRRFGWSRRRLPSHRSAGLLAAGGLAALLLIIPLRHLALNTSGPLTAMLLVISAVVAFGMGVAFDWRSGWCNTLCPIHPAERLYGQVPALSLNNARCVACCKCTAPCPDSTRAMSPAITGPTPLERGVGQIMTGCFAGFIWGWYQVPDYHAAVSAKDIFTAYALPCAGALLTLTLYLALARWFCRTITDRRFLVRLFAAAAVSIYYWYRIPELAGFGLNRATAMLWDLQATLPHLPVLSRILTTTFFVWFLLLRRNPGISWMNRPAASPATSH